ncbi:biotin--[acetyl-CoA-carboxylase] ligase [Cellulosimicrobium cellulans]|uniref:biotin--[acetyl-CoA-carboxylase] ligase n=1 Tax=Cellulosimicrobium cellulans TaxID=1710 RepID=UPI001964EF0B|nr:biotin--[acetyl-CoA-carboxylase] ligase [Cellulosimicrobium cellulans]MBN0040282.1 biotin--[acetyl-CoA-carboxylase] ligase [Cellulosimicrobium cellulans]
MASARDDESRPDGERPGLRAEFLRELLVAPAGPLARLEVVAESASTNAELARAVAEDPGAWPAPALLVAEHQPGGRGRLGRSWTTPPRAALLGSLLLRPDVPRGSLSWLPLLAGLATARALRATAGVDAVVKWPNDVLVPDPGAGTPAPLRKVAGILAEVLPDGGVVVGVGLNVSQRRDELPVVTATSLTLAGAATADREVVLVALHEAFGEILGRWQESGGDARAAGLDTDCAEVSATLGTRVRVERVGGGDVVGLATGLAPDGGLVVREDDGTERVHHSGDVHHLRPHD